MILFYSEGQLGNQLFQYAFLQKIAKNEEKMLVYGFSQILAVFDIKKVCTIKRYRFLSLILGKVLFQFLYFLGRIKIFSFYMTEKRFINDKFLKEYPNIEYKTGIFQNIKIVKQGFFQSESLHDKEMMQKIKIKKKYLELAHSFLAKIPDDFSKVFIHIRRGDFHKYTVFGKTTILPLSYYHEAINLIINRIEKPFFIFLTNDKNYVNKNFNHLENSIISDSKNFAIDFTIMTMCTEGILSASTFSYWAGFFMNKRNFVIAPKYWQGFMSKIEFPIKGFPSFAYPLEVKL